MREHFGAPEVLLGRLAHLVGLRPTDEPVSARDLLDGFSWDAMRAHADGGPRAGIIFLLEPERCRDTVISLAFLAFMLRS